MVQKYPQPENEDTLILEYQFFHGDSTLVSSVTGDHHAYASATSVSIYLPNDVRVFYDFDTLSAAGGAGSFITLSDTPFTKIPLQWPAGELTTSNHT